MKIHGSHIHFSIESTVQFYSLKIYSFAVYRRFTVEVFVGFLFNYRKKMIQQNQTMAIKKSQKTKESKKDSAKSMSV